MSASASIQNLIFLPFVILCLLNQQTTAQARPTASRTLGTTSFASFGSTDTAYRIRDLGVSFGQDITWNLPVLQPSLEFRSSFSSGDTVREESMVGGLQVERRLYNAYVYGNGLFGLGKISFPRNATYKRDRSAIWQYGGGLDAPIRGPFFLRTEVQFQSWRLGTDNPRITPSLVTLGLGYRPSAAHRSRTLR